MKLNRILIIILFILAIIGFWFLNNRVGRINDNGQAFEAWADQTQGWLDTVYQGAVQGGPGDPGAPPPIPPDWD